MPTTLTAADLDRSPALLHALLALNNADAVALAPADPARLRSLVASAFWAARIGTADALLIALDQDAAYDSPNFAWFCRRFPRFVYVDRVVTAEASRGRGLARALYGEVIRRARAAGHSLIVCEINAEPPNPVSDAFHRRLGFRPVGRARLAGGKTVTYVALDLPPPDAAA